MNRLGNVFRNVLTVIGLCVLVTALVFVFSSLGSPSGTSSLQPTLISTCVPIPHDQHLVPSRHGTVFPLPPSVTPLPLSKTTDLAPNLADQDKARIYVMHCNGAFELFLIGSTTAEISKTIPLQAGDTILNSIAAASSMGHRPPSGPANTPFGSPLATSAFSSNMPLNSPLATLTPLPLRTPIGTRPAPPTPYP